VRNSFFADPGCEIELLEEKLERRQGVENGT
jgi:hypothetical protein